jgi:predicted transglutaminase-like cysteine proteinase
MTKKTRAIIIAIFALPLLSVTASAASYMPSGSRTSQPIGHYDYCATNPDDCSTRTANPTPVTLTRKLWSDMQDVNNAANTMIEPITDMDQWGVEERWSIPVNKGDCEDYVLLKRKQLIAMGVPTSDALITVVRQRNGAGHAVLTVRTDRGDFILDNLEPQILAWNKTSYRYLKRQSDKDASQWISVQDNRQVLVGSVNP